MERLTRSVVAALYVLVLVCDLVVVTVTVVWVCVTVLVGGDVVVVVVVTPCCCGCAVAAGTSMYEPFWYVTLGVMSTKTDDVAFGFTLTPPVIVVCTIPLGMIAE